MKHVRKTFVRSPETMQRYIEYKSRMQESEDPLSRLKSTPIKEFEHWLIVNNEFPYDMFAEVHHMLVLKNDTPFSWHQLPDAQMREFMELKDGYIADNYDMMIENLPSAQTVPGEFHLHLIVLKTE